MAKIETKEEKAMTLRDFMGKNQGMIKGALAHDLDERRFMNIAWLQTRLNPKILTCTFDSILQCLIASAQLGLYPDGVSGYAHIIPRKIKGTMTACFQTGYLGLVNLFRRSGVAADRAAAARVVREKDFFSYEYGDNQHLKHVPSKDADPGPVVAYWAMLRYANDTAEFEIMSHAQAYDWMEKYAPRYDNKIVGPWVSEFDAMAIKTCLRKTCKLAPGPDLRRAIAYEERSDVGEPQQLDDGKTIDLPDFEVIERDEDKKAEPEPEPEKPKTSTDKLKDKLKKDKAKGGSKKAKSAPQPADRPGEKGPQPSEANPPPPEDTACKHGVTGMCNQCEDTRLAADELPFSGPGK